MGGGGGEGGKGGGNTQGGKEMTDKHHRSRLTWNGHTLLPLHSVETASLCVLDWALRCNASTGLWRRSSTNQCGGGGAITWTVLRRRGYNMDSVFPSGPRTGIWFVWANLKGCVSANRD